VQIEPDEIRLEINLTPGVSVADAVLSVIDRDRDGVISTAEAAAYAELLKRDLVVCVDQRKVELKRISSNFAEPDELRSGWGIMQIGFSIDPGSLAAGSHTLGLENHHLNAISAYLFNAALPRSKLIQIAGQKRNETQSTGEIEFAFYPPVKASSRTRVFALFAAVFVAAFAGAWVWRDQRVFRRCGANDSE
jgi:hypothetical protein